jgi:hypothetical protein
MTPTAGRVSWPRVIAVLLWTLAFVLIAYLAERRYSTNFSLWIVLPVALVLGLFCSRVVSPSRTSPTNSRADRFPLSAFLASVFAFAVGVAVRNGLRLGVRGGSADLAHHSAIVNVFANEGAGRFAAALPSLQYYPIGAHLPAALFVRVTGWDALSTTYAFSLLAVIGLFAAIAFVAMQLSPRNSWATAAALVFVGAAWTLVFLDSVMSEFFYSQEAGLAFAVAALGFAISWVRGSATALASMAFCGAAVGACYPTYAVLILPVFVYVLIQPRDAGRSTRVVRAVAVLVPTLAATALSTFVGPGADIVKNEGVIPSISADRYFGGSLFLFLALLAGIAAFGHRNGTGRRSIRDYLVASPWFVVQLWLVLSLVFFSLNWAAFTYGTYGSRYNSIKSMWPIAAGLAIVLGAFIGNLVPDGWLDGIARGVRPWAASALVLVVGIWSARFSPVEANYTSDQIRAFEFVGDSGLRFAPLKPSALDYILAVALIPLDPGDRQATAILTNDKDFLDGAKIYVSREPVDAAATAADGTPLTPICRFGSATVYAPAGSSAAGLVDRCPTANKSDR